MSAVATGGFTAGSVSSIRRAGFYACAGLLALIASADFVSHALDFYAPHHIHVVAHEIASAAVIACAVSQLVAPRRFVAAAQQLVVVFMVAWLMDSLTARFSGLGVVLLLGMAVVALHPARDAVFRRSGRFRPSLAIVAALGAIPLTIFAWGQAANQRRDVEPVHAALGHWEWVATVAMLIALCGLLAALGTRGFRVPAWSAGLGAVCLGVASLIYTGEASNIGPVWGAVAVGSGVAFIAIAEWEARRAESSSSAA